MCGIAIKKEISDKLAMDTNGVHCCYSFFKPIFLPSIVLFYLYSNSSEDMHFFWDYHERELVSFAESGGKILYRADITNSSLNGIINGALGVRCILK